jgi:hypothetical protein
MSLFFFALKKFGPQNGWFFFSNPYIATYTQTNPRDWHGKLPGSIYTQCGIGPGIYLNKLTDKRASRSSFEMSSFEKDDEGYQTPEDTAPKRRQAPNAPERRTRLKRPMPMNGANGLGPYKNFDVDAAREMVRQVFAVPPALSPSADKPVIQNSNDDDGWTNINVAGPTEETVVARPVALRPPPPPPRPNTQGTGVVSKNQKEFVRTNVPRMSLPVRETAWNIFIPGRGTIPLSERPPTPPEDDW